MKATYEILGFLVAGRQKPEIYRLASVPWYDMSNLHTGGKMGKNLTTISVLWEHGVAVSLSPKSESCFEQVVLSYEAALLKRALVLTGSRSDAEDLVQETLMRAWKQFCASTADVPCRAWLIRTMTNLFIDECRRRKRRPRGMAITPELEVAAPPAEPIPEWRCVTAEQLDAAIDDLEEEFRSVYVLRARHKLSYDEIAARLDIPRSTVGTRLHRARSKLKAILAPKEEA